MGKRGYSKPRRKNTLALSVLTQVTCPSFKGEGLGAHNSLYTCRKNVEIHCIESYLYESED
jgi:hypothetical protein